ncbi:uncharacterized protein LOC121872958 isoform X2 [Homarus americanus]|uniref:uncharacterized protein LOC121872958 isoform X2 n=1 Tax=Homarus americanus TaxID=6706 RepID=UPI001C475AC8|nr:uncharacterized protein LOC121872958 isoform X2 [Homarus americanus]
MLNPECSNCPLPRFLFSKKPSKHHSPPVYATIHSCPLSANRRGGRSTDYLHNSHPSHLNEENTEKPLSLTTETQDKNLSTQTTSKSLDESSSVSLPATNLTAQPLSLPLLFNQMTMGSKNSFKNFSVTTEQTTRITIPLNPRYSLNTSFPVEKNTESPIHDTHINQSHGRYPSENAIFNNNSRKTGDIYTGISNRILSIDTNKDSPSAKTNDQTSNSGKTRSPSFQEATLIRYNEIFNNSTPSNDGTFTTQKHLDSYTIVEGMDNATSNPRVDNQYDDSSQEENGQDNHMIPSNIALKHTTEKRHTPRAISNDGELPYEQQFTVTYWMFYPFNNGKDICTANLGYFLGRILKPTINGVCHGEEITMGNHVGDWEHVSIQFKGSTPTQMYVSAHTFGAYYTYIPHLHEFLYAGQDTRDGIAMSPNYPRTVQLTGSHPVLYAARGSHGLWGAPGIHQYMWLPLLKDDTGMGTAWKTWHNVDIIDLEDPTGTSPHRHWWSYNGRWGNPSIKCHVLMVGFCELGRGPTGIQRKRVNFPCQNANSRTP